MKFIKLFIVLLAWVTLPVLGQSRQQYTLAPTIQPVTEEKVEVIKFFWYGCGICNSINVSSTRWAQGRNDIVYKPFHVPLRPDWVSMTRAFYTLVQMNLLNELNDKIFDAMHKENIILDDENILFAWLATQNVDVARFKSIYNSFGTQTRVNQAGELAATYRLTGVPAFVVDGKYITSPRLAGNDLLQVLDQLVERAKTERQQRR